MPWFRRLLSFGFLCFVALSAIPAASHGERQPAPAEERAEKVIPQSFLGFSLEWGSAKPFFGIPETGTNPIFRQLIANLTENGNGPFLIRIGGDSTDTFSSNGRPNLAELSAYTQLHNDIGADFTLSVNLGAHNPKLAAKQAEIFVKTMPANALAAIEIGNEPDQFILKKIRPSSYSLKQYLQEFRMWQSAISPVLTPGLKVMGPSWARADSLSALPKFLKSEEGNLAIVSQHWYAGSACDTGTALTAESLLAPAASTSGAKLVSGAVSLTHKQGVLFRVGEMNSISCNGRSGVTDTFASALWMVDTLFEFANAGVDGVNVHMDTDDYYGPFLFNVDTAKTTYRYSIKAIRPEYYGMVFFQQAAPAGARLTRLDTHNPPNMKSWATVDAQNTLRITLINKDQHASRHITLRHPGYGAATVSRMIAPSFQSKTGISIAGLTFDGSQDGKPAGAPKLESIVPQNDVYEVDVPAASAVLLTLQSH